MKTQRVKFRLGLFLIAAVPRLLGAFFLPNTFGDAYVYIRDIGNLSIKIKTGVFAIADVYGFWLPLYQFISAIINVFAGNGFYTGKIVSAVFGVGVCLLVYAITRQLVDEKKAAFICFLLIALNPVHILTSTSALTDVPHGFFVLAALLFVLKRRWLLAATFAALAGLTRVESWMLIALIPVLQFWKERKLSIPAILIMLTPPLFWFWVSWKTTGDWLACFRARQQYHDWLLQQNPALGHFSLVGIGKDLTMLLSGTDIAVLIAVLLAAALLIRQRPPSDKHYISNTELGSGQSELVLAPVLFFFAFFALLMGAYLTHQQPIIFPRYGLILFSLGLPVLAWSYMEIKQRRPDLARRVFVAIVALCAINFTAQVVGTIGELNRYSAQRRVADYLRANFDPKSNTKIFCDEGTVRALSGIPDDRFLTSADAPRVRDAFVEYLHQNRVEHFVAIQNETSRPERLFPDSQYGDPLGDYVLVTAVHTDFLPINIHVYRRQ
jgi:hypothetical protein